LPRRARIKPAPASGKKTMQDKMPKPNISELPRPHTR
jgi:hypothetical protein